MANERDGLLQPQLLLSVPLCAENTDMSLFARNVETYFSPETKKSTRTLFTVETRLRMPMLFVHQSLDKSVIDGPPETNQLSTFSVWRGKFCLWFWATSELHDTTAPRGHGCVRQGDWKRPLNIQVNLRVWNATYKHEIPPTLVLMLILSERRVKLSSFDHFSKTSTEVRKSGDWSQLFTQQEESFGALQHLA